MTRARLQRALDYAAVAVALHGPAARPIFARLEAELEAFDAREDAARALDARATARAARLLAANQPVYGLRRTA